MVVFRSFKIAEFGHENRWAVVRDEPEGKIAIGRRYASRMAAEREVSKLNQQAASRIIGQPQA
jgi:hypothetical protein